MEAKKRYLIYALIALGLIILAGVPYMFFTGGAIKDNTPRINSEKCKDSDSGVYSTIKGSVIYIKDYGLGDMTSREYADFCVGNDVVEYFCNEKNLLIDYRIQCEEGCENGACITTKPICNDMCGDGICQEAVCLGEGCSCAETTESCLKDCSVKEEIPEEKAPKIELNWLQKFINWIKGLF